MGYKVKDKSGIGIKPLFISDQKDRKEYAVRQKSLLAIRKKDNRRKSELEEILRRKKKFTAEELYMIAMLYQHGSVPLDYKRRNCSRVGI